MDERVDFLRESQTNEQVERKWPNHAQFPAQIRTESAFSSRRDGAPKSGHFPLSRDAVHRRHRLSERRSHFVEDQIQPVREGLPRRQRTAG